MTEDELLKQIYDDLVVKYPNEDAWELYLISIHETQKIIKAKELG